MDRAEDELEYRQRVCGSKRVIRDPTRAMMNKATEFCTPSQRARDFLVFWCSQAMMAAQGNKINIQR